MVARTGRSRGVALPQQRPAAGPRVLVVSASIGEGHDLPARFIADGVRARRPEAVAPVVDGLRAAGRIPERVILGGFAFHSQLGNVLYDAEYALITHVAPVRRGFSRLSELFGARGLLRLVDAHRPDVLVSTYPGTTEVYGRLRLQGRLGVPLVSAITDLAALRFWAAPRRRSPPDHPSGVGGGGSRDRRLRRARSSAARGLTDRALRRAALAGAGTPARSRPAGGGTSSSLVSGGGWAVGDLEGATADGARGCDGSTSSASAGETGRCAGSWRRTSRLGARVRCSKASPTGCRTGSPAADLLVHSTAGLTVLEAIMRSAAGSSPTAGGWGHVRVNNRARSPGTASPRWPATLSAVAMRRALAEAQAHRMTRSNACRPRRQRCPRPRQRRVGRRRGSSPEGRRPRRSPLLARAASTASVERRVTPSRSPPREQDHRDGTICITGEHASARTSRRREALQRLDLARSARRCTTSGDQGRAHRTTATSAPSVASWATIFAHEGQRARPPRRHWQQQAAAGAAAPAAISAIP